MPMRIARVMKLQLLGQETVCGYAGKTFIGGRKKSHHRNYKKASCGLNLKVNVCGYVLTKRKHERKGGRAAAKGVSSTMEGGKKKSSE